MNKKDFVKLCFNFSKEPSEELFELWEYNLRCYDEDEMQKAINIIISQDKYFPTLNRILEVVKDIVNKEEIIQDDENVIREKMKRLNIHPEWLNKKIKNQKVDEETKKEFEEFKDFIKEFRDGTN